MADTQYLITSVSSHSGCRVNEDVIELAMPDAEKAIKDAVSAGKEPPALEFALATAVQALRAECHQQHKGGKDLIEYAREKLAKTDSLFSKLLGRKSKVQQSIAELESFESEINAARAGLKASEAKVNELRDSIDATQSELATHTEEAVSDSINQAAEIWHLRGRSPHNDGIVASAVSHAVEAEVVNRILHSRLVILKDKLAVEEEKIGSFKKQLKDLEKQSA